MVVKIKMADTSLVSRVKTTAGGMIGILRRLKNLIPVNAKFLLYKSAIMPHLTEGVNGVNRLATKSEKYY